MKTYTVYEVETWYIMGEADSDSQAFGSIAAARKAYAEAVRQAKHDATQDGFDEVVIRLFRVGVLKMPAKQMALALVSRTGWRVGYEQLKQIVVRRIVKEDSVRVEIT